MYRINIKFIIVLATVSIYALLTASCGHLYTDILNQKRIIVPSSSNPAQNPENPQDPTNPADPEDPKVPKGLVSNFVGSRDGYGNSDGTGSSARFKYPNGITTDGTNLYVADTLNHTIRRILIATGEVTTLAGKADSPGSEDGIGFLARFYYPLGITTDGINLYVSDSSNHTIRKIVIDTGKVTTIAGLVGGSGSLDGTSSSARFNNPHGITTDGANLYVAEYGNSTIRKIVIANNEVTTIAGKAGEIGSTDGIGSSARFRYPMGITTDGINVFVADTYNNTIRKIVILSSEVTTLAGKAENSGSTDGTAFSARFCIPSGITTDGTNLYVSDTSNYTIRGIVIKTRIVTTLAGQAGYSGLIDGSGSSAKFNYPYGIAFDGKFLYVADSDNHVIRKIE